MAATSGPGPGTSRDADRLARTVGTIKMENAANAIHTHLPAFMCSSSEGGAPSHLSGAHKQQVYVDRAYKRACAHFCLENRAAGLNCRLLCPKYCVCNGKRAELDKISQHD